MANRFQNILNAPGAAGFLSNLGMGLATLGQGGRRPGDSGYAQAAPYFGAAIGAPQQARMAEMLNKYRTAQLESLEGKTAREAAQDKAREDYLLRSVLTDQFDPDLPGGVMPPMSALEKERAAIGMGIAPSQLRTPFAESPEMMALRYKSAVKQAAPAKTTMGDIRVKLLSEKYAYKGGPAQWIADNPNKEAMLQEAVNADPFRAQTRAILSSMGLGGTPEMTASADAGAGDASSTADADLLKNFTLERVRGEPSFPGNRVSGRPIGSVSDVTKPVVDITKKAAKKAAVTISDFLRSDAGVVPTKLPIAKRETPLPGNLDFIEPPLHAGPYARGPVAEAVAAARDGTTVAPEVGAQAVLDAEARRTAAKRDWFANLPTGPTQRGAIAPQAGPYAQPPATTGQPDGAIGGWLPGFMRRFRDKDAAPTVSQTLPGQTEQPAMTLKDGTTVSNLPADGNPQIGIAYLIPPEKHGQGNQPLVYKWDGENFVRVKDSGLAGETP